VNKAWVVLAAVGILIVGRQTWELGRGASDVMDYRGEKIKLSKTYRDFSEYKNDPNNVHPSEIVRVQKLVMEAPLSRRSFSSRLELFRAVGDIEFPGYGLGSGGASQPDGSELLAVAIEIPQAQKDRYLLFRGRADHYELIDDFVQQETSPVFGIREESGSYVFYAREGKEFFRRAHRRP
jgi:hypothetical protein